MIMMVSILLVPYVFSALYVDKVIEVARMELGWEVDYVREAECSNKFR